MHRAPRITMAMVLEAVGEVPASVSEIRARLIEQYPSGNHSNTWAKLVRLWREGRVLRSGYTTTSYFALPTKRGYACMSAFKEGCCYDDGLGRRSERRRRVRLNPASPLR